MKASPEAFLFCVQRPGWRSVRQQTSTTTSPTAPHPCRGQGPDRAAVPRLGAMWQPFPPKNWGRGPELLYKVQHHYPVSYTHLRAHETDSYLVCRLLLEK